MRKTALIIFLIVAFIGKVWAQAVNEPGPAAQLPTLGATAIRPLQNEKSAKAFLNAVNFPTAVVVESEASPADKMGLGVINVATSWTDIPKEMMQVSDEENLFVGSTIGFGRGLIYSLGRGAAGVADVATCGIPPYNEPSVEPEYKVNHPNQGLKIDLVKW